MWRWKKKNITGNIAPSTFGYAHHQVICNLEGVPKDYIFLDVNPAYEEMTGLKRNNYREKGDGSNTEY